MTSVTARERKVLECLEWCGGWIGMDNLQEYVARRRFRLVVSAAELDELVESLRAKGLVEAEKKATVTKSGRLLLNPVAPQDQRSVPVDALTPSGAAEGRTAAPEPEERAPSRARLRKPYQSGSRA